MQTPQKFGLVIFEKKNTDLNVFKDLVHLMKHRSGRRESFCYIDDSTGLIPHLSLFENVQVSSHIEFWKEINGLIPSEFHSWVSLIQKPHLVASEAEGWERMLVGLLKGLLNPTDTFLVHIQEDALSMFMMKSFKELLMKVAEKKNVYLATSAPGFWLDSATCLVQRSGIKFDSQDLNQELLRVKWKTS
jgi:hypothetical protein